MKVKKREGKGKERPMMKIEYTRRKRVRIYPYVNLILLEEVGIHWFSDLLRVFLHIAVLFVFFKVLDLTFR